MLGRQENVIDGRVQPLKTDAETRNSSDGGSSSGGGPVKGDAGKTQEVASEKAGRVV